MLFVPRLGCRPNRQLVQKFMEGAVHLLAAEGEVHVALCKGQGGTPAEESVRKWADHWQIVPCAGESLNALYSRHHSKLLKF